MVKKFFLLLLLAAAPCYFFAQNITISPDTLVRGFNGNLTVTGFATDFTTATQGTELRLFHPGSSTTYTFGDVFTGQDWGGSPPSNPTTHAGDVSIPLNAPLGDYDVTLIGYGVSPWGGWNIVQNSTYNAPGALTILPSANDVRVEGKIIADPNGNCVGDAGDFPMPNAQVTINPGLYYALTDANGRYATYVPPTGT